MRVSSKSPVNIFLEKANCASSWCVLVSPEVFSFLAFVRGRTRRSDLTGLAEVFICIFLGLNCV